MDEPDSNQTPINIDQALEDFDWDRLHREILNSQKIRFGIQTVFLASLILLLGKFVRWMIS